MPLITVTPFKTFVGLAAYEATINAIGPYARLKLDEAPGIDTPNIQEEIGNINSTNITTFGGCDFISGGQYGNQINHTGGGTLAAESGGQGLRILANLGDMIANETEWGFHFWINPDTTSFTTPRIIYTEEQSGGERNQFTIYLFNGGTIRGYQNGIQGISGVERLNSGSETVSTGTQSFVLFTSSVANNVARVYVNGVLGEELTGTFRDTSTMVRVGTGNAFGGGNGFHHGYDGKLDDLVWYRKFLTSTDVANIHSSQGL